MIPANHEPRFIWMDAANDTHVVKVNCLRCGQASEWSPNRQDAEDWWEKHKKEIERLKARLGTRTPSLASQARYYRLMAEQSTGELQQQWERIAAELEKRVNAETRWEDVPLPGMP